MSFNQFELPGLPGLIKPRLQRAIEAEEYVPTFTRNGLHPVALMTFWRGGPEPNIHRRVGIHDNSLFLAPDAGELLIGLQHRTGLIVVDDERPEVLRRNIGGQVNLIGFAAIQWLAFGVDERGGVL